MKFLFREAWRLHRVDVRDSPTGEEATAGRCLRTRDGDVSRGAPLTFSLDGDDVVAYAGESIAAAALAHGVRTLRTHRNGEPRGVYCGMGVCFDCLVTVNGSPNQRACVTPVQSGMRVTTQ